MQARQGKRHPWNLLAGDLSPELLNWLRADKSLQPGTAEFERLGVAFEGHRIAGNRESAKHGQGALAVIGEAPHCKCFVLIAVEQRRTNTKTEEGRKFIMAGHLGMRCSSGSMCQLSVVAPFPLSRMVFFHQAFTFKNKDLVRDTVSVAMQGARRLAGEELANPNVQHFLRTPVSEWLLTCAELCVSNPTPEWSASLEAPPVKRRKTASPEAGSPQEAAAREAAAGWWAEAEHQDGGASILHMAVTLYGRRRLRCVQGAGEADMEFLNLPGSVYLGSLTGPVHQVHHVPGAVGDSLPIDGLGPCSVTVQTRTALFPACQSRLRKTSPAPRAFFQCLAEAFRQGLARGDWQLPSLRECQAFAAE